MNDSYELFKKIIHECNYSNTYKMAWAKGIVECLVEKKYTEYNDMWNTIKIEDIVKKMIGFYWDYSMFNPNSQSRKNNREPIIIQNVNLLISEFQRITHNKSKVKYETIESYLVLSDLKKVYLEVVKKSIKAAKENVSWRFARLHNYVFNDYVCGSQDDDIRIKKKLSKVLVENKEEIIQKIDDRWNEMLKEFDSIKSADDSKEYTNKKVVIDDSEISLFDIHMSNRLRNGLLKAGINTLSDFKKLDANKLLRIRNLGKKSFDEANILLGEIDNKFENYYIPSNDFGCEMTSRLKNCLINNGISNIEEFKKLTTEDLSEMKNLGKKTLEEAQQLLKELGVKIIGYNDNVKDEIDNKAIFSIYSKILIDKCGISIRLKNALFSSGINTLADLANCPLKSLKHVLGRKSFEEAALYRKLVIDEVSYSDDNSDFILRVIDLISNSKDISFICLKNFLKENSNYPIEKLVDDVNVLRYGGKIDFTMNGVKIRRLKLIDYINSLDLSIKMLIVERFNGKTLQELGDSRSLTRERIRQKLQKIIDNIPSVDEDKYREIFEKYSFKEEEFTKLFNEEKIIYYYLKEKYHCGTIDIVEGLNDGFFNDNQKNIIRDMKKMIRLFGETVELNRSSIINSMIKEYAKKEISIEKFTDIYNSFCRNNNYDLEKIDDRSMEGAVGRSGIALFGLGRKFRYYNFSDIIGSEEYEELKKIYYGTNTGYYSTLVIFKNNLILMSSLDIRNEYELHNLSKNYFNNKNGITFDRMPNFSINGITKEDFLEEKIKELSPISISDFCKYMETEYGHKEATLTSYIVSNMQEYIDNGLLRSNMVILPDYVIEKIKCILKEPIYSLDDFKLLLIENGFENIIENIITSANMYKIGYRIRSSYIMRKDINSIEDYIKHQALENDFILNDNFLKNSTYYTMMKRIEKNLDIFLISNDEYITIKKLNELGITKKDVSIFCNQVYERFKNEEYFTVSNVKDLIDINKLDDFGFDDIFFENIIGNIDNIQYLKFSNNKLYSFLYAVIDSKKFVLDCIGGRAAISIDELQYEIEDKYGIEVTQERIKNAIVDTDLYCSNELNKIYQNKEYYYEEVYHYE